jgi:hypothetical protein
VRLRVLGALLAKFGWVGWALFVVTAALNRASRKYIDVRFEEWRARRERTRDAMREVALTLPEFGQGFFLLTLSTFARVLPDPAVGEIVAGYWQQHAARFDQAKSTLARRWPDLQEPWRSKVRSVVGQAVLRSLDDHVASMAAACQVDDAAKALAEEIRARCR